MLLQQQGVRSIWLDGDILLLCALPRKTETGSLRFPFHILKTRQPRLVWPDDGTFFSGLRVILELKWLLINFRFRIHASSSLTRILPLTFLPTKCNTHSRSVNLKLQSTVQQSSNIIPFTKQSGPLASNFTFGSKIRHHPLSRSKQIDCQISYFSILFRVSAMKPCVVWNSPCRPGCLPLLQEW